MHGSILGNANPIITVSEGNTGEYWSRQSIDGGQYSKVLPEKNSYYRDYYPGLLTSTLLNRKE